MPPSGSSQSRRRGRERHFHHCDLSKFGKVDPLNRYSNSLRSQENSLKLHAKSRFSTIPPNIPGGSGILDFLWTRAESDRSPPTDSLVVSRQTVSEKVTGSNSVKNQPMAFLTQVTTFCSSTSKRTPTKELRREPFHPAPRQMQLPSVE